MRKQSGGELNKGEWYSIILELPGRIVRCSSTFRPRLSILILSLYRFDKTKKCVESLMAAEQPCSTEIIILDNNSDEHTKEELLTLQENYDNLTVIFSPTNTGVSSGRNICIEESKGTFILMIDNDCIVSHNFLTSLYNVLLRNKEVGAVFGKIVVDNKVYTIGRAVVEYSGQQYKGIDWSNDNLTVTDPLGFKERTVDLGPGGVTMYRKKIFKSVKHDPGFFAAHEDWDLMLSIQQLGYTIAYCPLAAMFHFPSRDPSTPYGLIRRSKIVLRDSDSRFLEKWGIKR